jgi:hypothetical protein
MPRFKKSNRWWTLVLTLCLGCALVAWVSSRASADTRMLDELGGRSWSGNGGPPPPSDGDPDTPTPSTLKRARPIAVGSAAGTSTAHVAGDGTHVESVMMWHFQVVLQSLRLWGFGRF